MGLLYLVIIMKANILPDKEYYNFDLSRDITKDHTKVMQIITEYLDEESKADRDQLSKIYSDIEKYRNFVCRFDDYKQVQRNGKDGKRVAYGAFRHSALEHSVQTTWSYTFEILDLGDKYYMSVDTWGWLPEDNLRKKVDDLLE
jgi:hypothetical protein